MHHSALRANYAYVCVVVDRWNSDMMENRSDGMWNYTWFSSIRLLEKRNQTIRQFSGDPYYLDH